MAFALLARHPGSGHTRLDLDPHGRLRFWRVQPYLVAYLSEGRPLLITRIFHGARDPGDLRDELEDDDTDPSEPLSC
jgi:plasmid stabilization system protein ParE